MTAVYRTAAVFIRNTFAGELRETDAGYAFAYDPVENEMAIKLNRQGNTYAF